MRPGAPGLAARAAPRAGGHGDGGERAAGEAQRRVDGEGEEYRGWGVCVCVCVCPWFSGGCHLFWYVFCLFVVFDALLVVSRVGVACKEWFERENPNETTFAGEYPHMFVACCPF